MTRVLSYFVTLLAIALFSAPASACHGTGKGLFGGHLFHKGANAPGCSGSQSVGGCASAPAITSPGFRAAPSACPGGVCPATLNIDLPAAATLTIEGVATVTPGSHREFTTPDLAPGIDYTYTLQATIDNQIIIRTMTVRAGESTVVKLEVPAAVAGR